MSCSRTQHSDVGEARTRSPSISIQALYHWATALPIYTVEKSEYHFNGWLTLSDYLFLSADYKEPEWIHKFNWATYIIHIRGIPYRTNYYSQALKTINGHWQVTWPEVIKLFSCSTQLSKNLILLINVKMPTIVGIFTLMSMINTASENFKAWKTFIFHHFTFYKHLKFNAQLSWAQKKFYNLGTRSIQQKCGMKSYLSIILRVCKTNLTSDLTWIILKFP